MQELYTTREVAELFEVTIPLIYYWKKENKLRPVKREKPNGAYLYHRKDIVDFIINTHLGKYKNSGLDIVSPLKKMGLWGKVELPETNRFRSRMIPTEKNTIYRERKRENSIVINNNDHTKCSSRAGYFSRIAKLKVK